VVITDREMKKLVTADMKMRRLLPAVRYSGG